MTLLRDESAAATGVSMKAELHAGSRVGQLYLSDDPRDNAPLTVHLVNDGDQPITLTPLDSTGSGTRLSMTFSTNLVQPGGLDTLTVSAKDWTCAVAPGSFPAIVMTPEIPMTLASGEHLPFLIDGFLVHGNPGTASIKVNHHNLGNLPSGTLTAQASLVTKPQPGFTVDVDRKQVFVTRQGETEVANTLQFAIRIAPTMPDPSPGASVPLFSIFFKYGDGYGTLTTVDRAKAAELVQAGGPPWKTPIPPKPGADDAVWMLAPASAALLKPGADVSFRLSNIVSQIAADETDFAPEPVDMYLQYSGVPGIPDGVRTVPLWKQLAEPGILHFWADRTEAEAGEPIRLSWATFAVDVVELHCKVRTESGIETDITYPRAGQPPLNLSDHNYAVYPTLEDVDYELSAYTVQNESRTRQDHAAVRLTGYQPVLGKVWAGDGYDGVPVAVHAQAYHADSITFDDPVNQRRLTGPLRKGGLRVPCGPDDAQITLQDPIQLEWIGEFDVVVDKEIMTVTGITDWWNWRVRRQPLLKAAHGAGATVVFTPATANIMIARGNSTCAVRAWKNGVAGTEQRLQIPIKPLVRNFQAAPIVAPSTGGPIRLTWTIDDASADLALEATPPLPGGRVTGITGTSISVNAACPTSYTLTATSQSNGEQSRWQTAIGRYVRTQVPIGRQALYLYPSLDGTKAYSLNQDKTMTVVDRATGNFVTFPLSFEYPLIVGEGDPYILSLIGTPQGFVTHPLGAVVSFETSTTTRFGPINVEGSGALAIDPATHRLSSSEINTLQPDATCRFGAVTPEGYECVAGMSPEELARAVKYGSQLGGRDIPSRTIYMRDPKNNAILMIVYDF